MRRLLIRVEGRRRPPYRIQIQPGTRIADIFRHLKIADGYVLTLASDPTKPFPSQADIHSAISDGEHLLARLSQEATEKAEAKIRDLFNQESTDRS